MGSALVKFVGVVARGRERWRKTSSPEKSVPHRNHFPACHVSTAGASTVSRLLSPGAMSASKWPLPTGDGSLYAVPGGTVAVIASGTLDYTLSMSVAIAVRVASPSYIG